MRSDTACITMCIPNGLASVHQNTAVICDERRGLTLSETREPGEKFENQRLLQHTLGLFVSLRYCTNATNTHCPNYYHLTSKVVQSSC